MAGMCTCCKLWKTTHETHNWDGTLNCLVGAAQNGCLRCSFLAKCITRFAPDISNEKIVLGFGNILATVSLPCVATMCFVVLVLRLSRLLVSSLLILESHTDSCFHHESNCGRTKLYSVPGHPCKTVTAWKDIFRHDIQDHHQLDERLTHWSEKSSWEWPLLNGGWMYQEMRLSRRVLHFCSQEVIWECREARRSESGCSDEDIGRDEPRYMHTRYEAVPYWKLSEDPRKLWYRTVQEYSRLRLTFEKDKMSALAALTHHMESLRTGDRFLAGLWEKTLLLDLLWMVWPISKTGRLSTWRAPTWSWTSVQSQVMWESSVDDVLSSVRVVDVRCTTTGPARMGEIQQAWIVLCVPLIRAGFQSGRLRLDPTMPSLGEIVIENEKIDYDFPMPGQYHIPSGTDVFIVPIVITRVNHRHTAIVLLKRQATSLYERVGYVEILHQDIEEMQDDLRFVMDMRRVREAKMDFVNSILMTLPLYNVTII